MANLDKLLKKIEKNKDTENEEVTTDIKIGDEVFQLRKLRRTDKREFTYVIGEMGTNGDISLRKLVKASIPFIYKSIVELPALAVRAKEAGYIQSNHDVVEEVFDVYQITNIVAELVSFNEIAPEDLNVDLENLKKQ